MDEKQEEKQIPKQAIPVFYKARGGAIKEIRIMLPVNPEEKKFTYSDLQIIGREIAKVVREDG